MRHFYILIIIGFLFTSSCEIINPDEDIPAKISIQNTSFKADHNQGTDSADIQDVWIYIDDDLIGSFQVPFQAPVLATGTHNLTLRPGIILNGIAGTRSINPFYTKVNQPITLVAGQTTTINPRFKYADGVIFPWNSRGEEDFEDVGISIDSLSSSSTKIFKSKADVYEGAYSGEIYLDAGHKTYRGESATSFDLPKSGAYVIMEINVKTKDIPLYIGMYVHLPGNSVVDVSHLMVKTSPEWKKLYVNFTELVSYYPNAESYTVSFKADLGNQDSAKIFLDNIKIMHF